MHNVKKRLVALIMTLVMAIGFSASAFAAEPATVTPVAPTSVSDEASTMSAGDVLAAGTTTIYGGSGSLSITLSNGNFWADLVAQVDYMSTNGVVSITVVTPDGDVINLGDVSGSGTRTSAYELFYAPSGRYTFTFYSAVTSPFDVTVFIYD